VKKTVISLFHLIKRREVFSIQQGEGIFIIVALLASGHKFPFYFYRPALKAQMVHLSPFDPHSYRCKGIAFINTPEPPGVAPEFLAFCFSLFICSLINPSLHT
jgi:hypothetical protein